MSPWRSVMHASVIVVGPPAMLSQCLGTRLRRTTAGCNRTSTRRVDMAKPASFISRAADRLMLQPTDRNSRTLDEENVGVSSISKMRRGKTGGKLGTFNGVWVPTTLNVLSILMFLRFGFILGQAGVLGMIGMLAVSYIINLATTLSLSAISSNGTVRGGGAYYLISRSLGPEFGGSIGLVFYIGLVFNTGMNAVGLVDCVINNFGKQSGSMSQVFPESFSLRYLYASIVLIFCTIICLLGSAIFSRASSLLLAILLISTLSIPISTLVQDSFHDPDSGILYTGLSSETLKANMWPNFTKGAAGGQASGRENWQSLFGLIFPATAGIFAGASMSGDLKNPSKSIPSGTLNGLLFTFIAYALVIVSMGASIDRQTLYTDLNVIQDINVSPHLILMGEFATSFFSSLMGVIGSAKSLQALARDDIFPGLSIFGQGTSLTDEPISAVIFTYLLAQLTLFADINTIASVVTMTYLVTFWVTNLACFLLKIGSAPNFRPTFKFFTWWTAASGAVFSIITMFFVDGFYASGIVGVILALFLIIHYTTPPKSWGDVSQSLIYHQVRKYLLRLRQEHVKFWRPQILLLVNDPRRSWKLIQFCNSMKKGGLYLLGHVIVTTEFQESFPEVKLQQSAWMKYIDFSKVKAFPQVAIAPTVEWGARNLVLSAGLGGMRPNIAVMGFYNLEELRNSRPLIDVPPQSSFGMNKSSAKAGNDIHGQLPTDTMRPEKAVTPMSYLNILEDLLLCLQMNVGVAKGFDGLELPNESAKKKYIDLWPIQMAAENSGEVFGNSENVLNTNFDTYTLILQLGCILNTVPAWKKAYKLRVVVFVEFQTDVQEERERVKKLLENLRIQAEVVVTWLDNGELNTYEIIVNGAEITGENEIDKLLADEAWWHKLQRQRRGSDSLGVKITPDIAQLSAHSLWPSSSYQQQGQSGESSVRRLSNVFRRVAHDLSELAPTEHSSVNVRARRRNQVDFDDESTSEPSSDGSSDDSRASSFVDGHDSDLRDRDVATNPPVISIGGSTISGWLPGSVVDDSFNRASNRGAIGSPPNAETHTAKPALRYSGPSTRSMPSTPKFSCKAIPETQVSMEDGPGPSVMFAQSTQTVPVMAGGRPTGQFEQKQLLSFNDLPSRGQHIILNELLKRHSDDTAVIFTTLPSPSPGTCKSEQESLDYLLGLEVLTTDLPPVLLVHSNSLTVTTSL